MKEAQPIFPIEDTVVNAMQDDNKIVNLEIRGTYLVNIAQEEHPELLKYLKNTVVASPELANGYATGFRTMYDVILRQLSTSAPINITRQDMIVHDYNVQENGIDRLSSGALEYWCDQSSKGGSTGEQTPVSIFMDRLKSSSQSMYSDVRETLTRDDVDGNEKIGYVRGLYDVFMPFYNKAEADHLETHLIAFPQLKKGVEAGYYSRDTSGDNNILYNK